MYDLTETVCPFSTNHEITSIFRIVIYFACFVIYFRGHF